MKYRLRVLATISTIILSISTFASCDSNDVINSVDNLIPKELKIALKLPPTNLDLRTTAGASLDQVLLDNVYEPLLSLDQSGTIIPSLAKMWSISEDSRTYDFTLFNNIYFSNKKKVSAKDYANSIQEGIKSKWIGYDQYPKGIKISSHSSSILRFELKKPFSELLYTLTTRAGVVYPKADFDYRTTAIGTGPFLVQKYNPNQDLTLIKNINYWGHDNGESTKKDALLDTVVITYISDDNAAVNGILGGQLDVIAPLGPKLYSAFSKYDDFKVTPTKGTDKFQLSLNSSFLNKTVRKAINLAINKQELIDSRGGYDKLLSGPNTELDPGYLPAQNNFNLGEAKKLMKGQTISLTLKYDNSIYSDELGDLIRSQLSKIGIVVNIKHIDFTTWLNEVYSDHDFDMTIIDHNEPRDFVNYTKSDYYWSYSNKKVNELYKKAMESKTQSQEDEYLKEASKIVNDDYVNVYLFNYQPLVVTNKKVVNFPFTSNQSRLNLVNTDITQ